MDAAFRFSVPKDSEHRGRRSGAVPWSQDAAKSGSCSTAASWMQAALEFLASAFPAGRGLSPYEIFMEL